MDSDKIERAIEFILKLQADAAARQAAAEARQADAAARMDRMEKTDLKMRESMEETDRKIKEFTASTIRFHEDMKGYIKILTPILEIQSRRLDRLEGLR